MNESRRETKNRERLSAVSHLLCDFLLKVIPIDSKMAFFSSFHGQYNDNPKAISTALWRIRPDVKQVWVIGEKSKETNLPSYIIKVKPGTFLERFYRSRSKVVVENYLGWFYGQASKGSRKAKVFSLLKKKQQFNLSTWHGTPLKSIEREGIENKSGEAFFTTSDVLMVGNKLDSQVLRRKTQGIVPLLEFGTARNDILFSEDKDLRDTLLEKMHLPKDKRICVYAPTFRDNTVDSGETQLMMLNIEKLCSCLSRRFGGEWIFVLRLHDSVLLKLCDSIEGMNNSEIVYPGNLSDDMVEYLYVSDVLLTDYSSSIFDYAITKKPCFLFCHDLERYEKVERGFYLDIRELPFSLSVTSDELCSQIDNFNSELYKARLNEFIASLEYCETGKASIVAAELIRKQMK